MQKLQRHRYQSHTQLVSGGFMPEKRLLIHILKRAANDYVGHYRTTIRCTDEMMQDALEWIELPIEDNKPEWSFAWICEALDLDGQLVQNSLKILREQILCEAKAKRLTTVEVHEIDFIERFYDLSTESDIKMRR